MLPVRHHEQNRDSDQCEEHRSQQSEGDDAGQRRPQAGPGENHGNDAHGGGRRSEEDGPQTAFSSLQRRRLQFHTVLHPFVDVIDQNDGVSDHQPAHADDADECCKSKSIVGNQQSQSRARQRQGKRRHHNQRVDQGAELEEQNQKDQHQAGDERVAHFTEGLLLVFVFTAKFDAVAWRQLHGVQLFARVAQNLARQAVIAGEGAHRQCADAVSAHNPARLPL